MQIETVQSKRARSTTIPKNKINLIRRQEIEKSLKCHIYSVISFRKPQSKCCMYRDKFDLNYT
jgi:hypothetical protein